MKTTLAVPLILAAALLAACNDNNPKPAAGGTNASTLSGNPLDAPAEYLGALGKAQQTAVKTADLGSLKQAIDLFHTEHDRYPATLQELVDEKFLPAIPKPPYGMKFTYDAGSGTVKVVKQ